MRTVSAFKQNSANKLKVFSKKINLEKYERMRRRVGMMVQKQYKKMLQEEQRKANIEGLAWVIFGVMFTIIWVIFTV